MPPKQSKFIMKIIWLYLVSLYVSLILLIAASESESKGSPRYCFVGPWRSATPVMAEACGAADDSVSKRSVTIGGKTSYCLSFQFMLQNNVTNVTEEITEFECDVNGAVCSQYGDDRQENVTYNGHVGTIHCCAGDRCNNPFYVPGLIDLKPVTSCYWSLSNDESGANVTASPCAEESLHCVTQYSYASSSPSDLSDVKFYCESKDDPVCETYGIYQKDECTYSPLPDQPTKTMRLCCCATNDCNVPDVVTVPLKSFAKWTIAAFLIMGGITMCGVFVLSFLAMRLRKHQEREEKKYRHLGDLYSIDDEELVT